MKGPESESPKHYREVREEAYKEMDEHPKEMHAWLNKLGSVESVEKQSSDAEDKEIDKEMKGLVEDLSEDKVHQEEEFLIDVIGGLRALKTEKGRSIRSLVEAYDDPTEVERLAEGSNVEEIRTLLSRVIHLVQVKAIFLNESVEDAIAVLEERAKDDMHFRQERNDDARREKTTLMENLRTFCTLLDAQRKSDDILKFTAERTDVGAVLVQISCKDQALAQELVHKLNIKPLSETIGRRDKDVDIVIQHLDRATLDELQKQFPWIRTIQRPTAAQGNFFPDARESYERDPYEDA